MFNASLPWTAALTLSQSQPGQLSDPRDCNSGDASACIKFRSHTRAANCSQYADHLLQVYLAVMAVGVPNFKGTRVPIPSSLHFEEDEATITYLQFGFPAGYEGPVPTPSQGNHPSANKHCGNVAVYITNEVNKGAMLGPFDTHPFTPWTHTNLLLTRRKKDSTTQLVIMDLSWSLPHGIRINSHTPKYWFLRSAKKKHLSVASDLYDLIHKAGWGSYLYSADVACACILPTAPRPRGLAAHPFPV